MAVLFVVGRVIRDCCLVNAFYNLQRLQFGHLLANSRNGNEPMSENKIARSEEKKSDQCNCQMLATGIVAR